MMFSAPQWTWRLDREEQSYGYVRNSVRIFPERGRDLVANVAIPTEFFQLLPLIFSGDAAAHAKIVGAELYIDQHKDRWIMGVETRDGLYGTDLWPYTASKLPAWLDVTLRRAR